MLKSPSLLHKPAPLADPWVWKVPLAALLLLLGIRLLDINRDLFLSLNHLGSYSGDSIWANITLFGDGLVALTLCLLLFHQNRRLLWSVVLAGIVVALLNSSLKVLFDAPRPPSILPQEGFTIIGPAHLHYSFPSGHTATIFALAGAIVLSFSAANRQRWGWLWVSFATLVGLSRIMVGVHWPQDVAAGALVGWLSAAIGWWLSARWHWGETRSGYYWLKGLLISGAVVLLLAYDTQYPRTDGLQWLLAMAALLAVLHKPWRQLEYCFKPHSRKLRFIHKKFPSLRMVCCLHKNFRSAKS